MYKETNADSEDILKREIEHNRRLCGNKIKQNL